jgi:hypothetical protein
MLNDSHSLVQQTFIKKNEHNKHRVSSTTNHAPNLLNTIIIGVLDTIKNAPIYSIASQNLNLVLK